jgi:hypothetical protein
MKARDRSDEGNSDRRHFGHLLSSILISLLVQRDVIRELSKLVGDGHEEEISESVDDSHIDPSEILSRDPTNRYVSARMP